MKKNSFEEKIISYLVNCTDWITAKTLASQFDVSIRSIKNYVSSINRQYDHLIISSNKGYKINKEKARDILNETDRFDIPEGYEARRNYIIKTVLLEKQNVTLTSLADYLCISPVTLQNEINRIRNELSPYRLNVKTKNDVVFITGLDADKRKVIIDLVDSEIKTSYYSIDYIQNVFPDLDVRLVQKTVTGVLNRYQYFLDNYSLLNYVLHLCLTIEIKGNKKEELGDIQKENLDTIVSAHTRMIVEDIYNELKKSYPTNYTLSDIYQASVLMMTRVVSNNTDNLTYKDLTPILGEDIIFLLNEIITSVNDTYCISLNNESFLIRFAFHLKNLIIRLEKEIHFSNLQFPNIKNEYPLIYAISVHISNLVSKFTGYPLPEDEIAYIALHIGMLMEEDMAKRERIRAIIVCTDYISIAKKIHNKLSSTFNENLLISNIVTSINEDDDLSQIELIITTEKTIPNTDLPIVYIDPFVSEANIRQIFSTKTSSLPKKISKPTKTPSKRYVKG